MSKLVFIFFIIGIYGCYSNKKISKTKNDRYCKIINILADSIEFKKNIKSDLDFFNRLNFLNKKAKFTLHLVTHPGGIEYPRIIFSKSIYVYDLLLFSNFYKCNCNIEKKIKIGSFSKYEIQLIKDWYLNKNNNIDTSIIYK